MAKRDGNAFLRWCLTKRAEHEGQAERDSADAELWACQDHELHACQQRGAYVCELAAVRSWLDDQVDGHWYASERVARRRENTIDSCRRQPTSAFIAQDPRRAMGQGDIAGVPFGYDWDLEMSNPSWHRTSWAIFWIQATGEIVACHRPPQGRNYGCILLGTIPWPSYGAFGPDNFLLELERTIKDERNSLVAADEAVAAEAQRLRNAAPVDSR